MKISVILPVYNEIDTISEILSRVKKAAYDKEIIVVDDASSDGTKEYLEKAALADRTLKVDFHPENKGKTAAIRTALEHVTGDIVIIQDGDLEYNPADYPKLVEPIVSGGADVVYGSRFFDVNRYLFAWHWLVNKIREKPYEIKYLSNFMGIQFLNFLMLVLYGVKLSDIATGYKVFRSGVIKGIRLDTDRFEFCYEVSAKIAKKGIKIMEVPIDYHPRSDLSGKKITWKDGVGASKTLLKYRFRD